MQSPITITERWILLVLTAFTTTVLFLNLGVLPLHGDEAIRGTVALEMLLRGDYVVPTVWGEFYYKKPPVYNWILIGFFKLFGYSELVLRLPSVLSLLAFGVLIWRVGRAHLGDRAAAMAAFCFVLSGRLLTRDSLLGHIDITYSALTFLGFFVVYRFEKENKPALLFTISYALAAVGVLMKGLPSFLFQGITLVCWLAYRRRLRLLLTPAHGLGLLVFAALVGGYFGLYATQNSLAGYFTDLYDQSAQRTVVQHTWWQSTLNLIAFPFENFGHLFPTSLFLLFAFRKGIVRHWLSNDFTAFVFITLVANAVPYWLSPGYYPRYIFMLYPLAFMLGAGEFYARFETRSVMFKFIAGFFLVCCFLMLAAAPVALWIDEVMKVEHAATGIGVVVAALIVLLAAWKRFPRYAPFWSLFVVAIFRLAFDLLVIPYRVQVEDSKHQYRKEQAEKIVALTEGQPVHVLRHSPLFHEYAYYLSRGKMQVIEKHEHVLPGNYYLAEASLVYPDLMEEFYRFHSGYQDFEIALIKLKE